MSTKGYKILGSALILALVVSLVLLVERQLQWRTSGPTFAWDATLHSSFRGKRDWHLSEARLR
jgi:hypothetical protein